MNAPLRPPAHPEARLVKHLFTLDDVLAMTAQGLLDRRCELLDGEIFDMPADGPPHARYTMAMARHLMSSVAATMFVGVQTTLRLSAHNAPSPDIFVLSGPLPDGDVPPESILLVVEVADTSLKTNLTDSADRYARLGVREYWVVDVHAQATKAWLDRSK